MTDIERLNRIVLQILVPISLILTVLGWGPNADPLRLFRPAPPGVDTVTVEAEPAAAVDLTHPGLGLQAHVTPQDAAPGQEVIVSVTLSNAGEAELGAVTVIDSLDGDLSASFPTNLPPGNVYGRSFYWTIPANAPDPPARTFTVLALRNGEVVSQMADAVVDFLRPAVEVDAGVRPAAAVPGDTVTCTVTVENVGQVDLEALSVVDSLGDDLSASFPPTLTAGASHQRAFAWVMPPDGSFPLTRTVTVRARGAGEAVEAADTAVVDGLEPLVRVEPSVAPTVTVGGGAATYTVTVVNAGEVDLSDLRIGDSLMGDIWRGFPRTLPAGASHTEAYAWDSPPDASGLLTRTVTVSGEGAGQVISDTATADLNLAGVAVSATGPARVRAGERVAATVRVANTSSAHVPPLVLQAVVDGERELAAPDDCQVLAPGEACTFSHAYTVGLLSGDEVLTSRIEARYRADGLAELVTDAAHHEVAIVSPWQKGTGIPVEAGSPSLAVCATSPDVVYAGFRDGGVTWSGDAGLSWTATALDGGGVSAIAIDPRDCGTVYAAAGRDGVMTTENGGRSWEPASGGLEGARVVSVAIDPGNPDVVYAGTYRQGVNRSGDGGATWRRWGLPSLTVTDLSVSADGQSVYAATRANGVHRRLDRGPLGGSWEAVNDGIDDVDRQVHAVAVDPRADSTVYAATSGGVYRTLDGGSTWRSVLSSPRPAYSLAIDPDNSDVVYAGTAEGVYRSVRGGAPWGWKSFDPWLEDLAVRSAVVGPGAPVVHLGTVDGAWRREP